MFNAFSRDIRSIRAQENIGVHSEAPLLVEHFSQKSDPYLWSDRRRRSIRSYFRTWRMAICYPSRK